MTKTREGSQAVAAWAVSGLEKVFADTPPPDRPAQVSLGGAAGECEVVQVAVHARAEDMLLHAPCVVTLRSDGGVIAADRVTCRFVELVPVRFATQGVPRAELVRMPPGYYPDPLCLEDVMHVPAGQTRSIWIRISIPADAVAGVYRGRITVKTSLGEAVVDLDLTVWPIRLPERIPFAMTLWVWPCILAKYHDVQLYSEPFWTLLETYAAEMAAHRQDTIFTPIIGPDSLVDVTRTPGGYAFDFSRFDRWVEIFFKAGFGRIEGSHLYDRAFRFTRVHDEHLARDVEIELGTGLIEFAGKPDLRVLLAALLAALRDHLRAAGWSDCYVQHIYDEPAGDQVPVYLELASWVRGFWPDVQLIDAADSDPALLDTIDVIVPLVDSPVAFGRLTEYRSAGKDCWCYTCNHPRGEYPNVYLDAPLIKTRIIPWIMFRYGLTGFLYYALGYWETQHAVARDHCDPYSGRPIDTISLYNPWLDPAQNATWRCPPGSWGFVYPPRDPCSQDPDILSPGLVENFSRVRQGLPGNREDEAPLPRRMAPVTGVVGSLRWEQLREGIEDYGLLSLLGGRIARLAQRPGKERIASEARDRLDGVLTTVAPDWVHYTRDPAVLENGRRDVAGMLVDLQEGND